MSEDTEIRISVDFKLRNFDLVEKALKNEGITFAREPACISFLATHGRIFIRDGVIEMDERDLPAINKVKVQYSRLVVKRAAAVHSYAIHEVSRNKFRVRKR